MISKELQWIPWEDRFKDFHGKRLLLKRGDDAEVVLLSVSDVGPNGERKEGHVLISCSPITENDPMAEARFDRMIKKSEQ